MRRAQPIIKRRTYLITRRCAQREFLLRPDEKITEGFKFILALAAKIYGIRVYAILVMSNHYHAVVRDERGVLPDFLHYLNGTTAHAFNVVRARRENFWSSKHSKRSWLVDVGAIVRMVVYTLVNPVEAHLVERAGHWPGLTSYAWLDGRTIKAERPRFYFDPGGDVPDTVTLQLSVPPEFDGDGAAWQKLIQTRVAEEEARLASHRRAHRIPLLGRKAVRTQSIHRRATTKEELRESLPAVVGLDPIAKAEAIRSLKDFRARYAKGVARLRARAARVVFPPGTWALARHYNVLVAPS